MYKVTFLSVDLSFRILGNEIKIQKVSFDFDQYIHVYLKTQVDMVQINMFTIKKRYSDSTFSHVNWLIRQSF